MQKIHDSTAERRYAMILGHPLGHTLSPLLHTTAFKELHLPYSYGVCDIGAEFLAGTIRSLRSPAFIGANVTVPYKSAIMGLLDSCTEEARAIGAVNTIVNTGGRLCGHNTDAMGIVKALQPHSRQIRNSTVLILGAGGAARAALFSIIKEFKPQRCMMWNRSSERARLLADECKRNFPGTPVDVLTESSHLKRRFPEVTVVVNATSVGMTPHTEENPLPDYCSISTEQIFLDIVYTPLETAMLRRAEHAGARIIRGLDMFLHQGASAFELWTGHQFPMEAARPLVEQHLRAL